MAGLCLNVLTVSSYAEEWAAFAYSSLRQSRLANITAIACSFGITIGADAGIAIKQQHAMFMVDDVSNMNTAQEQIRKATDWLVGANFDYLACESGYRYCVA